MLRDVSVAVKERGTGADLATRRAPADVAAVQELTCRIAHLAPHKSVRTTSSSRSLIKSYPYSKNNTIPSKIVDEAFS
jgi:hypothetical protein